jgi:phenylacetate-coenzyme A ligase PaaK-like adenylate-forming protein
MTAEPIRAAAVAQQVDELIRGPQYAMRQAEKDVLLTSLLRVLCREMAQRCPPYGRFLERLGANPDAWQAPADIPPLPAAMFKQFLLSAVPPEKVVRQLYSSSTTGQQPSRIVLDKTTAFRQARALAAILKEHIGPQRRPLLVLDAAESIGQGGSLGARAAAVRGVGNFASKTAFAMRLLPSGQLQPDWDALDTFFAQHGSEPLLLFGFTFLVWDRLVLEAERSGWRFHAPQAVLLHSGGWKKLAVEAVSKEEFSRRTAAALGCEPGNILDFYGMVEQVGTVFVDCEAGNKHAPAFADVLIRRPLTLAPAAAGETGIIEVLSALPTSYPGQALITEDQGTLLGVDDCPCGRRGYYFRFAGRIERAEVRGCGDTSAQANRSPLPLGEG